MATKCNYSTTIASTNNATLATVAANYGLKTVVDQPSTSQQGSRRWRSTALLGVVSSAGLRARKSGRLHLGAAGLQGRRQRPDRARPAVGRRHFLGGGLEDRSRPPGRSHHGSPGRRPRRQGGRSALAALLSTVDGLDTPLEVDTKIANALLGLTTVAAQLASR